MTNDELPKIPQPKYVRQLTKRVLELEDKLIAAKSVLEAVRSQLCWERDRDQATMGMCDLHDDITSVLEELK